MEKLAINKARKEFYKVLQMHFTCLDIYFTTLLREKNGKDTSQEIIEKFITTSRQFQSILRSFEE